MILNHCSIGTGAADRTLATYTSPTVSFSIGPVPMTVQCVVPIQVGINVEVTAQARFSSAFRATATIKAGFKSSTGDYLDLRFNKNNDGLTVDDAGSGYAVASIYLMPMAEVKFSYVGGPTFSVKAALDATALVSGSTCSEVSMDARVEATVGAEVGLYLPGAGYLLAPYTLGPSTVYKQEWSLGGTASKTCSGDSGQTVVGGGGDDTTCPSTCYGATCDYWIESLGYVTCAYLDSIFGCDCWGCTTCTDNDSGGGSSYSGGGSSDGSGTCALACHGFSCDYWDSYACDELESGYGCDCSGCTCGGGGSSYGGGGSGGGGGDDWSSGGNCPSTCAGNSCDYW